MQLSTSICNAIVAGAIIFSGCDDSPSSSNKSGVKTIEITADLNYVDDMAVWFSPTTGDMVVTGDGEIPDGADAELPPDPKYTYWIDPGDPEFSRIHASPQENYGIAYLSMSVESFNGITTTAQALEQAGAFSNDLFDVGRFETNHVFYLREEDGDGMIQIISWDQEAHYLSFRWKAL